MTTLVCVCVFNQKCNFTQLAIYAFSSHLRLFVYKNQTYHKYDYLPPPPPQMTAIILTAILKEIHKDVLSERHHHDKLRVYSDL